MCWLTDALSEKVEWKQFPSGRWISKYLELYVGFLASSLDIAELIQTNKLQVQLIEDLELVSTKKIVSLQYRCVEIEWSPVEKAVECQDKCVEIGWSSAKKTGEIEKSYTKWPET